jgi:hypothetical protein
MIRADSALFNGLSYYFVGLAKVIEAEIMNKESDGLRKASQSFEKALAQINIARECEKNILKIAEPIEYNAYFIRRHQVASNDTEEFRRGLELMVKDLSEGFYPAEGCGFLNSVLSRMTANWDLNARVEGVLSRLETEITG